jgi:hypothetical protein
MTLVVLGASGGTGRELVRQALTRGLQVRAVVRDPVRAALEPAAGLIVVRGDVHDAESIRRVLGPEDVVVSGLGVAKRSEAGTLSAGARAVVAARPDRIVWLGAVGTGRSRDAVGFLTRSLLRLGFGAEYADKVTADTTVLDAGGTVVHSGPLSDKPDRPELASILLAQTARRFFPAGAPRAAVARVMLDEATSASPLGGVLTVGLPRPGSGTRFSGR